MPRNWSSSISIPAPTKRSGSSGRLPRQFPAVSFFVMSQVMDANLLMEAMHLGVKEFIPLPMREEKFAAAIEARGARSTGMGKRARVISVIPTIGGCGSTTVACNVAAALAKTAKTVLVDLDLMRGGVANYFDIRPRYTIADVMESAEKVDKQLLDNALAVHGSGAGDPGPARTAGRHAARQPAGIAPAAGRAGAGFRLRRDRFDDEHRPDLSHGPSGVGRERRW